MHFNFEMWNKIQACGVAGNFLPRIDVRDLSLQRLAVSLIKLPSGGQEFFPEPFFSDLSAKKQNYYERNGVQIKNNLCSI